MQLRGEQRRAAREDVFEALRRDGSWRTTREAWMLWLELHGCDTRNLQGIRWALPEGVPWLTIERIGVLLGELAAAGRVERKQRARLCMWYWRVPEPEPVPDTFPSEWTREPVLT